jgi:hypothetical protein
MAWIQISIPLTSMYFTKWALNNIGVPGQYIPVCNIETDTTYWEPHNVMHTNTLLVLSPLESPYKVSLLPSHGLGGIPMGQFPSVSSPSDSTKEFWAGQQICGVHWAVQ